MKKSLKWTIGSAILVMAIGISAFATPQIYQGKLIRSGQTKSPISQTPMSPISGLISKDCIGQCKALVFVEKGILTGINDKLKR